MLKCPRCGLEFPRDPYKPVRGYYTTCPRCKYGPFWSEGAENEVGELRLKLLEFKKGLGET